MPTGYIVAAIVGVSLLVASSFIGGMLVFQHGMGVVSDGGSSQVPTATDTP